MLGVPHSGIRCETRPRRGIGVRALLSPVSDEYPVEPSPSNVTRILEAVRRGEAAADDLIPAVYTELRRLARRSMAKEAPGLTLQPTALVHEAYLRLVNADDVHWESRGHFFGAAAEAMRRILIERARRRDQLKRGGGRERISLAEVDPAADSAEEENTLDVLALDAALTSLERHDPRMAKVVKLRFFAGLTIEETAQVLGVTARTVNRDWVAARTWLWREMQSEPPRGSQA